MSNIYNTLETKSLSTLTMKNFQYKLKNGGYTAFKHPFKGVHKQQRLKTTDIGKSWMRKIIFVRPLVELTKTGEKPTELAPLLR